MKQFDLCIIGAGAGGLVVAYVAARLGFSVALIERDKMGGDCLNAGCVPSKSLLSVGKALDTCRHLEQFGLSGCMPAVDYMAAMRYVQSVINKIASNDSIERFEGLGVTVFQGRAGFVDKRTVAVNDEHVCAKRFVIATGSHAAIPPIKGLSSVSYLTNETLFNLQESPAHLLIIGAGPIGCEMAQAHLMLGCEVTMLDQGSMLPKDDVEATAVIRQALVSQGLHLHESVSIAEVKQAGNYINIQFSTDGRAQSVSGSHLLVAAGRAANVEGLQLEKAAVNYTVKGVEVNHRLQTSNRCIYALGDVVGGFQFTHVAGYQAGIVVRNILFKLPSKVDYRVLPWVTYCQPELAQVGLNEGMAKAGGVGYQVLRMDFDDNDRAQAEGDTRGFIKVLVAKKRVIGVTIVGVGAGELLLPWCLIIQQRLKLSAVTSLIAAYPTRSEISKRVAGQFFEASLFSKKIAWVTRFLFKWLS